MTWRVPPGPDEGQCTSIVSGPPSDPLCTAPHQGRAGLELKGKQQLAYTRASLGLTVKPSELQSTRCVLLVAYYYLWVLQGHGKKGHWRNMIPSSIHFQAFWLCLRERIIWCNYIFNTCLSYICQLSLLKKWEQALDSGPSVSSTQL